VTGSADFSSTELPYFTMGWIIRRWSMVDGRRRPFRYQ